MPLTPSRTLRNALTDVTVRYAANASLANQPDKQISKISQRNLAARLVAHGLGDLPSSWDVVPGLPSSWDVVPGLRNTVPRVRVSAFSGHAGTTCTAELQPCLAHIHTLPPPRRSQQAGSALPLKPGDAR